MTDEPQRTEEAREFGFETRQVHAGQRPDPNTGARAVPIYQTTSYVFEDPESAAAYFNLQEYGNTYSRIMNPTVAVFEERMASLEGGCGAVAFASGIAAQAAALFTLLQPGDHVVASSALYGGTVNQFKHLLRKLNVDLTWVDPDDADAWRAAVRENTKALLRRDDRQPRRQRARHRDGRLDRPRARGSADGRQHVRDAVSLPADRVGRRHRRPLGDEVHRRPRHEHRRRRRRFRASSTGRTAASRSIADPSPAYHGLEFHETFGMYGYCMKLRAETLRDLGAAMSPFNAFLFLQGLETLSLRMERHVENALAVAEYLESHALASNVTYPGLPTSRYRPLVDRYLPGGAGAVFSFDCDGGRDGRSGLHPRRHALVAPGERR